MQILATSPSTLYRGTCLLLAVFKAGRGAMADIFRFDRHTWICHKSRTHCRWRRRNLWAFIIV